MDDRKKNCFECKLYEWTYIKNSNHEVVLHRKKVWFDILVLFREGPPAVRRTWGPAKKFYLLQLGLISHLEIELAYSKNIYNSIWKRCKLLFPSHNRNHILFIKMLQNHRNWYMMDKGDKWNHGICLPFSPDLFYPKSPTCHNSFG